MEVIYMLIMFLFFVGVSLNDVTGSKRWSSFLDRRGITILIFVWSLVGFVWMMHFPSFRLFHLHYQDGGQLMWSTENIMMAGIPITLYLISYLLRDRTQAFVVLMLEFAFWIFILFCIKRNYSWNYEPGIYHLMYDYVSFVLRFIILLDFLKVREHKFSFAWLLAHIMILCKIGYFSSSCF